MPKWCPACSPCTSASPQFSRKDKTYVHPPCSCRWCIKIVKDAGKGLRNCPIMLNAGRGAAEPGVELPPPHKTSSQRANIFVFRLLFAPYGDGSAGVMTTPGSAPLRSPRPALSIIGQLRSPFSHFDTPSIIWLCNLLVFSVLYAIVDMETRHATPLRRRLNEKCVYIFCLYV